VVDVDTEGAEVAADWDHLESPETYLGSTRGERFVPERDGDPTTAHGYVVPPALRLNHWALDGAWTIRQDSAVLDEGAGTIAYRFRARDVNLVLASRQGDIPFRVLIDGQSPGSAGGVDCDEDGRGVVSEPRMYQLIRQRDSFDEHTFAITFEAPGVAAYVFTFG
jgi:hypothetical protein